MTEDGARRLIDIAKEIKSTKEGMLQDFATRTKDVEMLCGNVISQMTTLSAQVNDQMHQSAEQTRFEIVSLRQETHEELAANQSALQSQQEAAQQAMRQNLAMHAALESSLVEVSVKVEQQDAMQREKIGLIENELGGQVTRASEIENDLSKVKMESMSLVQQQQSFQQTLASYQAEVSKRLRLLGYMAAGLSVAVLGTLGAVAHLLRWV